MITGYACDSRSADAEFLFAKRQYISNTGRVRGEDDVIAYHLRQSFVPGEITPEEANRIGCELAKGFTKENHACVTDRDIMPDCAPGICINKEYTKDKSTWPALDDRMWRAEADYEEGEAEEQVEEIKKKADGQQVKTFVAGQWTLEYDLAYAGVEFEDMLEILVDSLIKVSYVECNRKTQKTNLLAKLKPLKTKEEKATTFYSFFTSKKASKADFAQVFACELEKKFAGKPEELKERLPKYIVDAIEYVALVRGRCKIDE